jgi:hypothetical protein
LRVSHTRPQTKNQKPCLAFTGRQIYPNVYFPSKFNEELIDAGRTNQPAILSCAKASRTFLFSTSNQVKPAGSKKCTEKPMTIPCISNNPKIKEQYIQRNEFISDTKNK